MLAPLLVNGGFKHLLWDGIKSYTVGCGNKRSGQLAESIPRQATPAMDGRPQ